MQRTTPVLYPPEKIGGFTFLILPGTSAGDEDLFPGLVTLYEEVFQESGEVWPVIPAGESSTQERVQEWVYSRLVASDQVVIVTHGAKIVAAAALASLRCDSLKDRKYWNDGAIQAAARAGCNKKDAKDFLAGLGLPVKQVSTHEDVASWIIDPDKISVFKGMGVSPQWRRRNIGRNLLRHSAEFVQEALDKCMIFNVITGSQATEGAIALYEAEGAVRVGYHHDGSKKDSYKMLMYAFVSQ